MAARVSYPRAAADPVSLPRCQFRHAVGPLRIRTMDCRCVDNDRIQRCSSRYLFGSLIRKTQNAYVSFLYHAHARFGILALLGIDLQNLYVRSSGQIFVYSEPCCTMGSVDEYFVHFSPLLYYVRHCIRRYRAHIFLSSKTGTELCLCLFYNGNILKQICG